MMVSSTYLPKPYFGFLMEIFKGNLLKRFHKNISEDTVVDLTHRGSRYLFEKLILGRKIIIKSAILIHLRLRSGLLIKTIGRLKNQQKFPNIQLILNAKMVIAVN